MRIGIVGLGLMGGSIASALKSRHEIVAYDLNAEAVAFASAHGLIQQGCADPRELFSQAELIYLCLYPQEIVRFIQKHQKDLISGTVLVDISGVKRQLINQVSQILRPDVDIVFTHPVAGREKKGIAFAKAEIFQGANYIIVPTAHNQDSHLELVRKLALEMGFKTVSNLNADEHDAIIAYTSQLTHVLSLALVDSDDALLDTKRFIGDSYRDLTRIAMINEVLWSELFLANQTNLLDRIKKFQVSLTKYVGLLETNDAAGLQRLMLDTRRNRANLEAGEK
jgi:prephenate dehydrogenase